MVDITAIRSKITEVLGREDLNREVTVKKYSIVEDTYGDNTRTLVSTTTLDTIVIRYNDGRLKYDPIGLYQDSTFIVLFEHDYDITDLSTTHEYDVIVDGITYLVTRAQDTPIAADNVYRRIFVRKE